MQNTKQEIFVIGKENLSHLTIKWISLILIFEKKTLKIELVNTIQMNYNIIG